MCDLARERQKIDAMLARAVAIEPARGSFDRQELVERSLSVLREHYEHACSEKCMRERCEDFVERLLALRREQMAQPKGAPSRPATEARAA